MSDICQNSLKYGYILAMFLTWITFFVSVASELHWMTVPLSDNQKSSYHYNYLMTNAPGAKKLYYDSDRFVPSDLGQTCNSSGKGLIAMTVFVFLFNSFTIITALGRMFNSRHILRFFNDHPSCLKIEYRLSFASFFFLFVAILVWGCNCYAKTKSKYPDSTVYGSGFGYIIFCLFVSFITIFVVRKLWMDSVKQASNPHSSDAEYVQSEDVSVHVNNHSGLVGNTYYETETVDMTCRSCMAIVRVPKVGSVSCTVCGAMVSAQ